MIEDASTNAVIPQREANILDNFTRQETPVTNEGTQFFRRESKMIVTNKISRGLLRDERVENLHKLCSRSEFVTLQCSLKKNKIGHMGRACACKDLSKKKNHD